MHRPPPVPIAGVREELPRGSRLVCVGCGVAVIALSLVVMGGWVLGLGALERVAPGLPAMTPDTAIGLGGAGLALVCLAPGSRWRRPGRWLGGLVSLLGLSVIFEYLVAPLGIDQLLFKDPGVLDPGRPSPHTAVALIAIGAALVTSDVQRLPGWVHQAFLAVTATVAVSALVGYIYDVDYLRGVSGTNGMAVHTLAAVIILTAGTLALHPDRGLLGMMRGDGGAAVVARAVVPMGCLPLGIGTVLFAMQRGGVVGSRLGMSLFTLSMVGVLTVIMIAVTARARLADTRTREVSDRLRALFDHIPAAMSLRGLDGRFLDVNEAAAAILGQTVAEVVGNIPRESSIAASLRADDLEIRLSGGPVSHEQRVPHADGGEIDYQVIRYPVRDRDGKVLALGTVAFDITEQKQTIAALEVARERFRSMFDEAPIGMAVLALDGSFAQVNEALCHILGYPREHLEGLPGASVMGRDDLGASLAVRQSLLDGAKHSRTIEVRLQHAAGHRVAVDVHTALLRGPDNRPLHFLIQVQDITERKRDRAHLAHLADHDPLTGVQNRRAFQRTLAHYTTLERRQRSCGSLMVIDLDQFKQINDTLGHQTGDELIVHTARLLQRQLRTTDVIARLGGDEFAVLLPNTEVRDAVKVGEGLLNVLRTETAQIPGLDRSVSASIGVASLDEHPSATPDEILQKADQAMYEAKTTGRDRISAWSIDNSQHKPLLRPLSAQATSPAADVEIA